MTNLITLTIPNDDHIALRAFGKALEEMALAHGAEPRKTVDELTYKLNIDTSEATAALERLNAATVELMQASPQIMNEPEVDTTAQQVESLAANVVDREVHFNNPASQVRAAATDSTGTPWDERIHSASKALNADGTWRLRRKPKDMDELEWSDYVSMIKADLQYPVECGGEGEEIGEPTREEVDELIEASNKMLEPPVTPPGDDFHTDAGVVTEQTVAGIPPIPVPPPVVVAPPVLEVTEWDFPRLMTFLTERHGKIDVATVNTLLAQDGMSSVQELNTHPDKIGPFVARVKAHLGE